MFGCTFTSVCNKDNTAARVVIVDFGMATDEKQLKDTSKGRVTIESTKHQEIDDIRMSTYSLGNFFSHFQEGYNMYSLF